MEYWNDGKLVKSPPHVIARSVAVARQAEANPEIPHFVRNRLRNPMKSSTYKTRDCFTSFATTTFWTFYETINDGIMGKNRKKNE